MRKTNKKSRYKDDPPVKKKSRYDSYLYNPKNWGVDSYDDKESFNKAYSSSKNDGKKEFLYGGKRYNTRYKGTPGQEHKAYGVDGNRTKKEDYSWTDTDISYYDMGSNLSKRGGFLSGHISSNKHEAGVNSSRPASSIDARPGKTYISGLSPISPSSTYRVYGSSIDDDNRWYDKREETKKDGTDWNLLTNNCADGQCDAFGVEKNKGLQTPSGALKRIKSRYPVMDVTGRTSEDYKRRFTNDLNNDGDILDKATDAFELFTDEREFEPIGENDLRKDYVQRVQGKLNEAGYNMSSSMKSDGTYDGVVGKDTRRALGRWKKNNSKK